MRHPSSSPSSSSTSASSDFSPSQALHLARPLLASLLSLAAALVVLASPLSGVYILRTVGLVRGEGGEERWEEGGIGFWGGCLRDPGGSFLSQSCTLSFPFPGTPPIPSSSHPLPSFPTLLPTVLLPLLPLSLLTLLFASLTSHVLNSYILWGSLSELGRPEGSVVPLTPAGRLRFGEGRWRRKWRERGRKVGRVGFGASGLACAIILLPLLPSVYTSPPPSSNADVPISLLLTPDWGLLLLVISGGLMIGRKEGGLRKGRRGSSVSGIGFEGRKEGKVVDFNLPLSSSPTTSPLSSPTHRTPPSPHSPFRHQQQQSQTVFAAPSPRRTSLTAPWLEGYQWSAPQEEEDEEDEGDEVEEEEEGKEGERWVWTKEV